MCVYVCLCYPRLICDSSPEFICISFSRYLFFLINNGRSYWNFCIYPILNYVDATSRLMWRMLLHEAVVVVVVEEEGGMVVAAATGDRMEGMVEVGVVEVVTVVVGNIRNVAIVVVVVVVGKLMDRNSWEGDMPLEDVLAVAAI